MKCLNYPHYKSTKDKTKYILKGLNSKIQFL